MKTDVNGNVKFNLGFHADDEPRVWIYQDEKSGVTVGEFRNTSEDFENWLDKRTKCFTYDPEMPDKIRAVSRVRDGDEWNAQIGKREVMRRLDDKHQKLMKQKTREYIRSHLKACLALSPEITKEVVYELMGVE